MRYMITGATGFVGGHLARKLLDQGHELNALVRDMEKAKWLKERGTNLFKGDITEKGTLYPAAEGVDGIFHLAAWYKIGARDSSKAEDINVNGTRNVLEVMKELSIVKAVYTSTLAVFSDTNGKMVDEGYRFQGKHLSEYDRTKWKAHYEVALPMIKDGLPLVIVQPGVVYGPGDTSSTGEMMDRYLQKDLPIVPKGTEWCWSHVEDIVDGHLLAMEKGTKGVSYIIAGERRSIRSALGTARDITGIEPSGLAVPPWMLKTMSYVMTPVSAIFPVPAIFRPESLRVSAGVTYLGSNEKARSELGYDPMTLKEGFEKYLPKRMKELGVAEDERT
ncbi:MAG: NAD-dependent epimerase/dehydratase family protein [Thermoplasmatota archaeon]